MQSDSGQHYINSVSDLYGTDEIEFLLDDIRDLEPHSCNPEDIQVLECCGDEDIMSVVDGVLQDFEIAGSRTGGGVGSEGGLCGAPNTPGGECEGGDCECACEDSPQGTVHSWDSHAGYHHRLPHSPDHSLFSGVILYCDHTHLKSPTGVIRILLVITTVACLTCLCTSGTVKVGLFMLPLVGRIRLMMFVTLISLLVTCLLLFLDISHIVYLFPFNWGKLNAWIYVCISVLFLLSSSLLFHTVFLSEAFSWVPKWTHHQLFVTGCLGYVCCIECVILTAIQKCNSPYYQPVAEDPSLTLQERHTTTPPHSPHSSKTLHQTQHNFKPVSNYSLAIPSTSKQNPNWPADDIQPCSSKSADPYRLA